METTPLPRSSSLPPLPGTPLASPPTTSVPPAPAPPSQPAPPSSPPPPAPPVKTSSHLGLWLGLFFLLLLIGVGALGYIFITNQKKEVKDLAKKQVEDLKQLENKYSDIVKLIKESQNVEEQGQQLLGLETEDEEASSSANEEDLKEKIQAQVLALEDDPGIALSRRVGELYREAKTIAEEIGQTNDTLIAKTSALPLNLFLPTPKGLTTKTADFSEQTTSLLGYLDDLNRLEIKISTLGYEIGMAINEALVRGADDTSVKSLENKINELNSLRDEFLKIDTAQISEKLRQEHYDSLNSFEETKKLFTDILDSFRQKNLDAIVKSFQSLLLQATSSTESSLVEILSFWQDDPTIRSVGDLKKEWQTYHDKL